MLPELKTFFIAMSPLIEIRGAMPVALEVYNLPFWSALFFSVLGNLLPAFFIVLLLEPCYRYLSNHLPIFNRFFNWLFTETRKKHKKKFEKWEKLALVILVAIPLPFTGAWTAALCSFLFGIRLKEAFPLISLGVLIAGLIVALVSSGIFGFLDFIL